ncbi:hypothetical protein H8356DRAFT_1429388 [Neocallimastix lanati (nom. inval.)]|nr:hypothetical protein H8356DRAFT_1429388 [Neocallimastix sp. JGI-2020a]
MEENITIYISESNKEEEQIIINKQYKFNFSHSRKDNSRVYKCTEYKLNNKCKSCIILNNEKEILKYESLHNHPGNEYSVSLSVMKHKIKDEIKKHSNPFDIKRKRLYNEISKEMGFIYPCPEYISVKTLILRSINKKLPSNVTNFNEIPNESEYCKTERNEDFMIFKNSDLVIFQSPFQAKLFKKYNNDIFVDGTFYIAPKFSQQVFITRTYVKELNSFYTTSYAILRNKKQKTYKILFNKLKQNSNNNIITEPKNVHCDFEKVNDDEKIFNYYKGISNLPFINPEYIMDIFSLIKTKSIEKNSCQFLKFLEYFYETYLFGYDMKNLHIWVPIFHMAIQLLNNCKLRRSQSSLHTARRCIPNVPTYISNDHEHQNGTINSSLVGVIIGDWKFYNHQGLCFNSKRSIKVGLMDITYGLMISQDRNLIRLFVTCIVLTD